MVTEIRTLDGNWTPDPVKPKAETQIAEVINAKGQPITADEIVQAVGAALTPWKVKNTLKKTSTGARAVFAVNDGKYTVRAAA